MMRVMDDLIRIQKKLSSVAISDLHEVETETGVPFGTLFKIKYGTTRSPRYDTVQKLCAWARARVKAA